MWLPHQVGLEFYENRINEINKSEKSYQELLEIIEKMQKDIELDFKHHSFLDLEKINTIIKNGLNDVKNEIGVAKNKHPKLLENDDILYKINSLFEERIGKDL